MLFIPNLRGSVLPLYNLRFFFRDRCPLGRKQGLTEGLPQKPYPMEYPPTRADRSTRSPRISLVMAVWIVLGGWHLTMASAATVQDFDTIGTDFSIGQCVDPPGSNPTVMPGGPTGNFLRLVTTTVPYHNTLAFNRTDPGLFSQIVADFDFRITPGPSSNGEGLGFALLNTAFYKAVEKQCPSLTPFAAEEPNFTGSLGIGFDVFQNTDLSDMNSNHISVHFNATVLTQVDVTPIDLANGQWIHARIIMKPGNNGGGSVSVILTPTVGNPTTVVDNLSIPGFKPYEGRVFLGARSGGLAAEYDLDNINVQSSKAPNPSIYGAWSNIIDVGIIPIHAHLLPTGKVLFWQNGPNPHLGLSDATRLWDPNTGFLSYPATANEDIFCSGHTFLANGTLFVTGGHHENNVGIRRTMIYDPFKNLWINDLPDMNAGRWYPSNTTLGNGDILVVSGDITKDNVNALPQVWEGKNKLWRNLANAERNLPLYPWMFLSPNGKVFNAGPNQDTQYLDTLGLGVWNPVANTNVVYRDEGSAVMYDNGKILITGGGGGGDDLGPPPTNTAEIIDLNALTPLWHETGSMAYGRRYATATLLPDGTVIVTNGTRSPGFNNAADAVYVAEIWNPNTGQWSTMAGMHVPRTYHSISLLLPDGRVITGGSGRPPADDVPTTNQNNIEIYSPPYLFRGARPTITTAPDVVNYGQTFFVKTPNATNITNVNWIRLSSVTHAFDQSQRINKLQFQKKSGGLSVVAPSNPNITPPGYYMLFILNKMGVPSVAKILRVQ